MKHAYLASILITLGSLSTLVAQVLPCPLVIDIRFGSLGSSPAPTKLVSCFGNTLFFRANDGRRGYELWTSDGTNAGTRLVRDIHPGGGDSEPSHITSGWVGTRPLVVFQADDGTHGPELWTTDGTAANTYMIKDIYPGSVGSAPVEFTLCGDKMFFVAKSSAGIELWVTDGTAPGTRMVRDIHPGQTSSSPKSLISCNEKLYFSALEPNFGRELWTSDGTAAGTDIVRNIHPGSIGSFLSSLTPCGNGQFVFAATDGTHGMELWISDGSPSGTRLLKDIWPGASNGNPGVFEVAEDGGLIFFRARNRSKGVELWKSDLSTAGTVLVEDVRSGSGGSYPSGLTYSEGLLFFRADDGKAGPELWVTDGTSTGTRMLEIRPGASGSRPINFIAAGPGIYFGADDGNLGTELYMSDGAGASLVCDINKGRDGSGLFSMEICAGKLFFTCFHQAFGTELFVLDKYVGTAEPLGQGCLPGSPRLRATSPIAGGEITLEGTRMPAGPTLRYLIFGKPAAVPYGLPPLVRRGCAIWVQQPYLPWPHPQGVSWTQKIRIPNNPALIGTKGIIQGVYDPSPLTVSNAIQFVVGR